jgi:hypothetical protein
MSAFTKVTVRKPARTLVIPVTMFADDWYGRPTASIAVGLRLLSEHDLEVATACAHRFVADMQDPERPENRLYEEVFGARLAAEAVARAICDPNDVSMSHSVFPASEDTIPTALTPKGIEHVWAALERMHIELNPALLPIRDPGVRLLRAHLRAGSLDRLGEAGLGIRKLLTVVLEKFVEAAPTVTAADVDDEDAEDSGEPLSTYAVTLHAGVAQ